MSNPQKQHLIPKVYLKYFSANEDGKELYIIDRDDPYNKNIQLRNSNNAVFKGKNFYTSTEFSTPFLLEKFFATEIEYTYPALIDRIKEEEPIEGDEFKAELFQWIFYSKFRSPIFRTYFKDQLMKEGIDNENDLNKLSKASHLRFFLDEDLFKEVMTDLMNHLYSKVWTILVSGMGNPFWTSDSPGFCISMDRVDNETNPIPSPFWHQNLTNDTLFFFPLTKKYALQITPYESGTPVEKNLTNTDIIFKKAQELWKHHFNFWTLCTSNNMIISSDMESLFPLEAIGNKDI
nr:DUF4238 domain-containing protein [Mucilaginibacter sp. L294]